MADGRVRHMHSTYPLFDREKSAWLAGLVQLANISSRHPPASWLQPSRQPAEQEILAIFFLNFEYPRLGYLQPFPLSNSPQTYYLLYFTTSLQKIPPPITHSLQPFSPYLFPLYTITH